MRRIKYCSRVHSEDQLRLLIVLDLSLFLNLIGLPAEFGRDGFVSIVQQLQWTVQEKAQEIHQNSGFPQGPPVPALLRLILGLKKDEADEGDAVPLMSLHLCEKYGCGAINAQNLIFAIIHKKIKEKISRITFRIKSFSELLSL